MSRSSTFARLRSLGSTGAALAAVVATISCGDTSSQVPTPLNLERPVDVAFGCYGGLRLVGDNGTADASDPVIGSAQSMEACRLASLPTAERAPGQELIEEATPVAGVEYFAFILQSVPGTVALAEFPAKDPATYTNFDVNVFDADPLTPGQNAVAVGDFPVAIAADPAGCHMVTANAGSCDLSLLEITPLVDSDPATTPVVHALDVTSADGEVVLARPAAMAATPYDPAVGAGCPAEPEGLVWIAYPECHLVAAVRIATGRIEAGVRFTAGGTVELTDGNVSCPAQCGAGDPIGPGERPVTLDLVHDERVGSTRLAIGADNSSFLTMVELDADALPLSFSRVELSGGVGVLDLALSPQIGMGGVEGTLNDEVGVGGQFQFVYAVADDGTVRVADVLSVNSECDTQVDPRFQRFTLSVVQQACYRVGDPGTPPRRALARGPGIELVDGTPATSVAIIKNNGTGDGEALAPGNLIGYFAYVSGSSGEVAIVNIDDDRETDTWVPAAPIAQQIAMITAHQLRDAVVDRGALATVESMGVGLANCTNRGGYDGGIDAVRGGPRLTADPGIGVGDYVADRNRLYARPGLRRVACFDEVTETETSVLEMHFAAPEQIRDATFPDLRAMRFTETWSMLWEGRLSNDDFDDNIDGPSERGGLISVDGDMRLIDPSRPFCDIGVEPWDWVELLGCDASSGDSDCGLGMTCYVHPDAVSGAGQCLPAADADALAGPCRDFLLTARRFGVSVSEAGELTLVPRRKTLATTPLTGCDSDAQCADLAVEEAQLLDDEGVHPREFVMPADFGTYACRFDPSRAPMRRCVQVCTEDAECGDGALCFSGECREGAVPPAECVPSLERYAVHAGGAYSVIGTRTGYLHSIVEEAGTGACVKDPTAHPLLAGRIPMMAPPCTGDGFTDLAPNPCTVMVEQTQLVPIYEAGCAVPASPNPTSELITETVPAIRFQNPAFSFHLVRPTYPGDAECREDGGGSLVNVSFAREGQLLALRLVNGFAALHPGISPVFPVKVLRGPEESVWVVDHGDTIRDISNGPDWRGQVFRVEPGNFDTVNIVR